jgi:predicted regulator of amino acid metabolism with ACT domain
MWDQIKEKFTKYPARTNVARKMIELGIRVGEDQKLYCDDLKINTVALAKSADVDRKAVKATINSILEDEYLSKIFKNIIPAGTLLKNIAKSLNLGVIEIETERNNNGILTEATNLITTKGISIRQAYANDTEMDELPVLTVITENPADGSLIKEFLKIQGVRRVSIY